MAFDVVTLAHLFATISKTIYPAKWAASMYAEKVSISLSPTLMQFVEEYKVSHERKSRSQVIEEAVTLLRERELETAYCEADNGALTTLTNDFAPTVSDGLNDEVW